MSEKCINCGDEIDDDGVYAQSGVKSEGLEKLADGESIGMSELMEMNDGPYCSLGCSMDNE